MNIEGLAYCGIFCNGCPIYWATREPDPVKKKMMRAKIAAISNEKYGSALNHSDITDCDGCKSNSGILFKSCSNCEIRKCVRGHNYEYCSMCPEYPCEILQQLYSVDAEAKIWMDILKSVQ